MAAVAEVWKEALPEVMRSVNGVGVWTALRSGVAIAVEEGTFVLGLPGADTELAGHLRLPQTRRAVEETLGRHLNQKITLRVISGTTEQDWETEKRRDAEKRRLQEQALARQRAEIAAGRTWEGTYEQLSRLFAETPNRSLPQNRARYLMQAIDIVAEALVEIPINDDMAERNYARCLERVAQYTELPSTLVALKVLERTFAG